MKIVLITQDEPFYLQSNLSYLLKILPKNSEVVGCVLSKVSPFGKKESFLKKALKTYKIFGLNFFLYYSLKYLKSKMFDLSISKFLEKNKIDKIILKKSINSKESLEKINLYEPDLLISILGNQIFKKELINLAPKGCLNLHTALLPKYRGLMPTFWVLKNNEKYTGVSVFFVDEGIDSGPILVQKKVEIKNRTQEDLIKLTKKIGMEAIAESVDLIMKNNFKLIKNPRSKMTYFSFPKREDVIAFKRLGKKFF